MRLKVKRGTQTKVLSIDDSASVADLAQQIISLNLTPNISRLSFGFPPKFIELSSSQSLRDAGIQSLEQITVEESTASENKTGEVVSGEIAAVHLRSEYLLLRNVPDDNSCLFNAISYAVNGTFKWPEMNLRGIVAETIRSDPVVWNEAILGQTPEKYCAWINKKDSWGGAIELGILATTLGIQIICYDVETANKMVFQDESALPSTFIVLVYSGIHYDCFVSNLQLTKGPAGDNGKWAVAEQDDILTTSYALVKCLQSKNYTTNTTTFRVRCLECYEILVGETGAQRHANEKNHFRFGEVS